MPAFLSYAFFFRQKESVKRRTTIISIHIPWPRERDLTFLIQATVFLLKIKSNIKSRFRDNFSVTSILIIIANSGVTENSSRAKFDSEFLSFQQPLRHGKPCPFSLRLGHSRLWQPTGLSFTTARSAAASPCLPPARGRQTRTKSKLVLSAWF